MERKQTATKVCVALAAQLKASGGTADELRAKGGWFARNFYPV